MKTFGKQLLRVTITVTMVVIAAFTVRHLWIHYMDEPWTRDGRLRADIVGVAPDVSGIVGEVFVSDNQRVAAGDTLFAIDPVRFELAVRQAQAQLATAQAALDQAGRDMARYDLLERTTAVPRMEIEQARTRAAQARADHDRALADLDLAKLNLARSRVTAPVAGIITNFSLRPGNYVTAGQAVTALVDEASYYVSGYFEETKLPHVKLGDTATILLMGESRELRGHVVGIAAGIVDRERSDSGDLLANITPTFSWVRLAQRVPVRIELDDVPADLPLISGRTATIILRPSEG
ncbi:efflux RND transporter periplasmic adaptor subunit [Actomonas aquatica]|uniref:HlyD family secretion protein n=1 Tax=Actomonas aquatica TaxID=2866162 RepID=A0ABZ1C7V5_9BACT|nr:HlyD family secretion protein [Opitutus sp. WL0086]WRQ86619.1 HlyD family secretion protein [Opitutus sp. WL0086]